MHYILTSHFSNDVAAGVSIHILLRNAYAGLALKFHFSMLYLALLLTIIRIQIA